MCIVIRQMQDKIVCAIAHLKLSLLCVALKMLQLLVTGCVRSSRLHLATQGLNRIFRKILLKTTAHYYVHEAAKNKIIHSCHSTIYYLQSTTHTLSHISCCHIISKPQLTPVPILTISSLFHCFLFIIPLGATTALNTLIMIHLYKRVVSIVHRLLFTSAAS